MLVYAALGLASLVTSFISGILGMAGGMILMGVLLAFLPLAAAMMLHGVCQFTANGWRAFSCCREIDWRVFRGYDRRDPRARALRAPQARGEQARRADRNGAHALHRARAAGEAARLNVQRRG
jgi:hypothetical protein